MASLDFKLISQIQDALVLMKPIMQKKDDTSNDLADVWNTLLDVRIGLLRHVFNDTKFNHTGLMDDFKQLAHEKEFQLDKTDHSNT